MSDFPDLYECETCSETYFPTSQREDCPHEYNTSFTRAMRDKLKELLARGDE